MRRSIVSILSLIACAGLAAAADFPLESRILTPSAAFSMPSMVTVQSMWATEKPSQVVAEDQAASAHPLYAVFHLAKTGAMAARLDQSDAPGGPYDRLILDRNVNGDLRDDPVIQPASLDRREAMQDLVLSIAATSRSASGQNPAMSESAYFVAADCRWLDRPDAPPTALCLRSSIRDVGAIKSGGSVGNVYLAPCAWLQTRMDLDGREMMAALIDSDCNLRLGEPRIMNLEKENGRDKWTMVSGDALYRDLNDSGKIEFNSNALEGEPLGPVSYFSGKPYVLEISADGRTLRAIPSKAPTGKIAVKRADLLERLSLGRKVGGNAWEVVNVRPDRGELNAPEGEYGLFRTALRAAARGDCWETAGTNNYPDQSDFFEVKAGKTVDVNAGAPVLAKVSVERAPTLALNNPNAPDATTNQPLSISVEPAGAGGEELIWFLRDGERVSPGKVRILDENKKEIAELPLDYG